MTAASLGSSAQVNNDLTIGKTDSLYSKLLQEERRFWVHVPKSLNDSLYGKRIYPVIYLLDGNDHFYSVSDFEQFMGDNSGRMKCPDMIVVGIFNTDRTRDLTPTHASSSSEDSAFVKSSGGGERFTNFLQHELIPYIEARYPVAPYRMFIGHSFGGLMAINTLINHSDLFNSYVAIDPGMWWDDQHLLKHADSVLGQRKFFNKTLFLSIANTMQAGMDTTLVRQDTSEFTLHIRSILQFSDCLKKHANNGLRWSCKYYPDDDHGSVPLISEYDAIRFIFQDYHFAEYPKLFDGAVSLDSTVKMVTRHFQKVSQQMGYNVLPPERMISGIANWLTHIKIYDRAYAFLQMNLQNYPGSFHALNDMGDFYMAKGEKKLAKVYYVKALAIRNYADTKQKLTQLQD